MSHSTAQAAEAEHLAQVYAQLPFEPVRAEGVTIETADGRQILDLYGGHAVACLGYAHPRILETLAQQARSLHFQTNAVALHVRARAAARLASLAPEGLDRVFFVNSGAEANENALRLAFKTASGRRVVAIEHAFHGRSAAAGAVTWGALSSWYGFPRTPFPVDFVPRNDLGALARAVTEETAAVILEPIQGVAGAYDLKPDFVQEAKRLSVVHRALLILDEVQCGVGRTGYGFAAELYDVLPDLLTTAKSLGGGFPVGAVVMSEAVADGVKIGDLGTTFGGGPLACALVETVLEVIESEGLLSNVRRLEKRIRESCRVGPVEGIQGAGFLLGLRCTRPAREVRDALLSRDILVGVSADPNVIRLLPPFTLREEHVERLATTLKEIEP